MWFYYFRNHVSIQTYKFAWSCAWQRHEVINKHLRHIIYDCLYAAGFEKNSERWQCATTNYLAITHYSHIVVVTYLYSWHNSLVDDFGFSFTFVTLLRIVITEKYVKLQLHQNRKWKIILDYQLTLMVSYTKEVRLWL